MFRIVFASYILEIKNLFFPASFRYWFTQLTLKYHRVNTKSIVLKLENQEGLD